MSIPAEPRRSAHRARPSRRLLPARGSRGTAPRVAGPGTIDPGTIDPGAVGTGAALGPTFDGPPFDGPTFDRAVFDPGARLQRYASRRATAEPARRHVHVGPMVAVQVVSILLVVASLVLFVAALR